MKTIFTFSLKKKNNSLLFLNTAAKEHQLNIVINILK